MSTSGIVKNKNATLVQTSRDDGSVNELRAKLNNLKNEVISLSSKYELIKKFAEDNVNELHEEINEVKNCKSDEPVPITRKKSVDLTPLRHTIQDVNDKLSEKIEALKVDIDSFSPKKKDNKEFIKLRNDLEELKILVLEQKNDMGLDTIRQNISLLGTTIQELKTYFNEYEKKIINIEMHNKSPPEDFTILRRDVERLKDCIFNNNLTNEIQGIYLRINELEKEVKIIKDAPSCPPTPTNSVLSPAKPLFKKVVPKLPLAMPKTQTTVTKYIKK